MPSNQTVAPIGLIREVFSSEITPQLFAGVETHEPALRLVAQLTTGPRVQALRAELAKRGLSGLILPAPTGTRTNTCRPPRSGWPG